MKALLSLSCSELSCENRQLSKLLDKEQIHWRKLRTKNCNEQSVTLKINGVTDKYERHFHY